MGQKANPNAIRLGINRPWDAKWYPSNNKDWAIWLNEDRVIRDYFRKFERKYFIGRLLIERNKDNKLFITLFTSRPGVVLGKEGNNIKELTIGVNKAIRDKNRSVEINVIEIKNPDLNAQLVANEIAIALENRTPFRIIQKKLIARVMKSGAKGVKTRVSGRLNGVDMARSEGYSRGIVPLQTFRNDIDFATAEAHTTYGVLGVKVWISKDEILKNSVQKESNFEERTRKPAPKRPSSKPTNLTKSRNEVSSKPTSKGENK